MKIAVGSINPTKIDAAKEAFETVFPDQTIEVVGLEVSSGISNQPLSDKEALKGARNRAAAVLETTDADFGVGEEGGMQEIDGQWFETGWIVIKNRDGIEGVGTTIRMEVPRKILQLVESGSELGVACDIAFQEENTKHKEGFFGLMTNGHLSRTRGYKDGIISAVARFLHPDFF